MGTRSYHARTEAHGFRLEYNGKVAYFTPNTVPPNLYAKLGLFKSAARTWIKHNYHTLNDSIYKNQYTITRTESGYIFTPD